MLGVKYGEWGKEKYGVKAKVNCLEWYRWVLRGIVGYCRALLGTAGQCQDLMGAVR